MKSMVLVFFKAHACLPRPTAIRIKNKKANGITTLRCLPEQTIFRFPSNALNPAFRLTDATRIAENARGPDHSSGLPQPQATHKTRFMRTPFRPSGEPASPTPEPEVPGTEAHLRGVIRGLEARQQHLVSLLGSARDAVLEMDSDGLITSWNASAEHMLGWSAGEALGQRMCELIVPHAQRAAHEAGLAAYLKTGQARTIQRLLEVEALHKSGALLSVELSIFTVPAGSAGGKIGFGAFIRDISKRRAAERAARLSQERYHAVIEHVNDGVVVIQRGQVVFANQRAAAILAIPHAEIMRQGFFHLLHADDQLAAPEQGAGRREMRLLHPGRELRWLSVGSSDIPWDGETASLTFFSDITESRVLSDTVRRSTERYRAVIEHVDEGMIVVKDERIAYANERAAQIAGISLDDMLQVGFLHRIHPDDHALVLNRQRRRLAGEDVPSRYELRLLLPDGEIRWIGISVTVVPWDGEQAILTFFSDISQRRALEEKLRDTLEERETILENSLVGIAFLTHEGVFRWSNQAMAKMFGVSSATPAPRDWSALFSSQQEYLRVAEDIAACMNEGRAYQGDLQMRRLDGSLFWVTASGKAVSVLDKTQGSVWAVMDITQRKELEAALARASSEREAIFNSALVGISFNVGRRIQWVNDKYQEMTGYSREELVGKSSRLLYADDATYESDGKETRAKLVRDGVYIDERQFWRRNGETLWVQLAGRCVNDRNPDAGVIWTLLDITERRKAEDNIRAALEREKELNDLRSRFVSMTSHEFRTPLAAILSAAELLRDYSDRMPPDEKVEILESIGAGVQRMARMLDRVLLIGQVEAQMLEFRPGPTDLLALCHAIVEEARVLQPKSDCKVVTRFPPSPPPGLFDAKLLRHILGNLLSNAIKYSPNGGQVAFRISIQADCTVFEVEDQGIGIPPDEMPHLFESFHRASNVGDIPGTGLGLAIVKNSVELHGGKIAVRSEPGRSTCFTVTL
jgi:PAS domain S-box-containing protein